MIQMIPRARRATFVVGAVAAALTLVAFSTDTAAAKRKPKSAKNLTVVPRTPLGLQGAAGAGERTVLPLLLTDRSGRRVDVDVEYGVDRDGDGVISDGSGEAASEFRSASHRRRDARDTGRVKQRANGKTSITFRPARSGASHAFVWDSLSDLGRTRALAGSQIVRDAVGRVVLDPFDRTQPLFTDELPGVVLRVRAVRRGGKRQRTEWVYTEPFSVDNSLAPTATVDEVTSVDVEAGLAEIAWTAFDDDSEDANGNGILDVLDLEDRDADGVLDEALVSVAFDYHRLDDGERIPTAALQLAELTWLPCTPADGLGDGDVDLPSAPRGVGRAATYVWDYLADLVTPELAVGSYLVRAIPYDALGNVGAAAYLLDPLVIESVDD